MMSVMRPLTMKNSGLILVGSMWILFRQPWNSLPNGESPYPIPSQWKTEQKASTVFIRSRDEENPSGSKPMPTFDPSDLIGRTFLLPPEENGERHRAKVTRQGVEIIDQDNGQRVENINFILDIGNGKVEELLSYNQLLEHLENAQDHDMGMDQELYRFRAIIDTKVLCLPQIQTGKEANIMFKLNGRLGRSPLNPSRKQI